MNFEKRQTVGSETELAGQENPYRKIREPAPLEDQLEKARLEGERILIKEEHVSVFLRAKVAQMDKTKERISDITAKLQKRESYLSDYREQLETLRAQALNSTPSRLNEVLPGTDGLRRHEFYMDGIQALSKRIQDYTEEIQDEYQERDDLEVSLEGMEEDLQKLNEHVRLVDYIQQENKKTCDGLSKQISDRLEGLSTAYSGPHMKQRSQPSFIGETQGFEAAQPVAPDRVVLRQARRDTIPDQGPEGVLGRPLEAPIQERNSSREAEEPVSVEEQLEKARLEGTRILEDEERTSEFLRAKMEQIDALQERLSFMNDDILYRESSLSNDGYQLDYLKNQLHKSDLHQAESVPLMEEIDDLAEQMDKHTKGIEEDEKERDAVQASLDEMQEDRQRLSDSMYGLDKEKQANEKIRVALSKQVSERLYGLSTAYGTRSMEQRAQPSPFRETRGFETDQPTSSNEEISAVSSDPSERQNTLRVDLALEDRRIRQITRLIENSDNLQKRKALETSLEASLERQALLMQQIDALAEEITHTGNRAQDRLRKISGYFNKNTGEQQDLAA